MSLRGRDYTITVSSLVHLKFIFTTVICFNQKNSNKSCVFVPQEKVIHPAQSSKISKTFERATKCPLPIFCYHNFQGTSVLKMFWEFVFLYQSLDLSFIIYQEWFGEIARTQEILVSKNVWFRTKISPFKLGATHSQSLIHKFCWGSGFHIWSFPGRIFVRFGGILSNLAEFCQIWRNFVKSGGQLSLVNRQIWRARFNSRSIPGRDPLAKYRPPEKKNGGWGGGGVRKWSWLVVKY